MNTIDALNKLAMQRAGAGKYSMAMSMNNAFAKTRERENARTREPANQQTRELANPLTRQPANPLRSSWIVWLIFSLAVLFLLGLNLSLFFMIKDYPYELKIIRARLDDIAGILSTYERQNLDTIAQIKQLGSDLAKVNSQISEADSRISKLETAEDGTKAALENLTKAKDTLFSKVGSLESEVATLKNSSSKNKLSR